MNAATPAPTHAAIAADTRKRRAAKYARQAAQGAALKRYCADRKAAIASGAKLPNMKDYA